MAEKMIEIKLTKCRLILTEAEITKNLPPEIIVKGITRGKYEGRCDRVQQFYDLPGKVKGVDHVESN